MADVFRLCPSLHMHVYVHVCHSQKAKDVYQLHVHVVQYRNFCRYHIFKASRLLSFLTFYNSQVLIGRYVIACLRGIFINSSALALSNLCRLHAMDSCLVGLNTHFCVIPLVLCFVARLTVAVVVRYELTNQNTESLHHLVSDWSI